jgi:Sulfotransferase family
MIPFTFLMCSERSGSNFTTALMNGHEDVSGPPPTHMFRLFGLNHERYEPIADDRNWAAFKADFTEAFDAMPGAWSSEMDPAVFDLATANRSIAAVLTRVYSAECAADGAQQTFVKENQLYGFIPFIVSNWPEARIVHQIRDPRDMALSWLRTQNMPGGLERAVSQWIADQQSGLDALGQWLESSRVLRVRYEDILAEPQSELERLCRFAGVNFSAEMLDFHKSDRTRTNASMLGAWANLDKPILSENSRKYREGLTAPEIEYVELRCADLMAAFGYSLDSDAAGRPAEDRAARCEQLAPDVRLTKPHVYESESDEAMRTRRRALIERVTSRAPFQPETASAADNLQAPNV